MYQNQSKEAEKIFKYDELILEFQSMWNVKTKLLSVVTDATGIFSKSLSKYLRNITVQHEIKEQHNTAIVGTAHILRKVLM